MRDNPASPPFILVRLARFLTSGFGKTLVFVACALPLCSPALRWVMDPLALGANPAEYLIRAWGDWALQLLLLTLLITPLRIITGIGDWYRLRRMLGLFAFASLSVHMLAYLAFDRFFILDELIADLIKRPFITLGLIGFVCLLPLAITSSKTMVMRMGGQRWALLHRLIYPATILAVVHYWLMVKRDLSEPFIYACLLTLLLIARLPMGRQGLKSFGSLMLAKKIISQQNKST